VGTPCPVSGGADTAGRNASLSSELSTLSVGDRPPPVGWERSVTSGPTCAHSLCGELWARSRPRALSLYQRECTRGDEDTCPLAWCVSPRRSALSHS